MLPNVNLKGYFLRFLIGILLPLFSISSYAEPKPARLAFVIGNSDYSGEFNPLPGASTDATNIAKALSALGFNDSNVEPKSNLTKNEIITEVAKFKEQLSNAGGGAIGFLYYAGHGGADRENTDNFLIPVDAARKDITLSGISMRSIQRELQQLSGAGSPPAAMVVVLDACRTLAQQGGERGSVQKQGDGAKPAIVAMTTVAEPENGFLFAFSTSKNQTATDSGVFGESLAKRLLPAGLTLPQVFEEVQRDVYVATSQNTIYQPNITAKICLRSCDVNLASKIDSSKAIQILKDAQSMKPEGDMGQVDALQSLSKEGKSIDGLDLSGIGFPGVDATNIHALKILET